jgi:hypothetical protein
MGPSIGGFLAAHARAVLNLESILGALVTLVIVAAACRRRNQGAATPTPQPVSRWVSWVGLPAIAALVPLAFWRSLHVGLLSDDFILVRYANEFTSHDLAQAFKTGGGDGFFRPAQYLEWVGLARLAGWQAESWHLVSWFFHAAMALLVYALARRLRLPAWESLFAAGLFVVLGSRPEAVIWITGFNGEMAVTFLMLCGLLLFVRSLELQGGAAIAALIGSWIAMVVGILSNEFGYIFPLLLVLWLASQGSTPVEALRRRYRALIPFFAAAAMLFAYRWRLFGGMGGYLTRNRPQALHFGLATLHALFGRLWGVLYFPINWTMAPNLAVVVLGMFYVAALLWLAVAGCGRQGPVFRKDLLFPAGFIMVAALPPLHLLMIGPDLMKTRLLYPPSVGFCLLLAVAVRALSGRAKIAVMAAVLAFHFAALQHNIGPWLYASAKSQDACRAAAICIGGPAEGVSTRDLPQALRGVYFIKNGFSTCVNRASLGLAMPHPAKGPVALSWDSAKDELICRVTPQ